MSECYSSGGEGHDSDAPQCRGHMARQIPGETGHQLCLLRGGKWLLRHGQDRRTSYCHSNQDGAGW